MENFHFQPRWNERDWITFLPETTKTQTKHMTPGFSRHWTSGHKEPRSQRDGNRGGEPDGNPGQLPAQSFQATVQG